MKYHIFCHKEKTWNVRYNTEVASEETFKLLYQALLTLLTVIVSTKRNKTAIVAPLRKKEFAYDDGGLIRCNIITYNEAMLTQ